MGDSLRLRAGLVRANRHHVAVYASAVSVRTDGGATITGQHQRSVRARERANSTDDGSESELGPGTRRVRCGHKRRIRLFTAVELHGSEDVRAQSELRGGLPRLEEYSPGAARMEPEPIASVLSEPWSGTYTESAESILRTDPGLIFISAADDRTTTTAACVSAFHKRGAISG